MRVKLGRRTYACTVATLCHSGDLILLTTSNGVYTVKMGSEAEANYCHRKLLIDGYYDFSDCEYSN